MESLISRILMRKRWKTVSLRGSRVVVGNKRMNIMVVHWVIILEFSRVGREPIRSFGEKPRVGKLALQRKIWLRQILKLSQNNFEEAMKNLATTMFEIALE